MISIKSLGCIQIFTIKAVVYRSPPTCKNTYSTWKEETAYHPSNPAKSKCKSYHSSKAMKTGTPAPRVMVQIKNWTRSYPCNKQRLNNKTRKSVVVEPRAGSEQRSLTRQVRRAEQIRGVMSRATNKLIKWSLQKNQFRISRQKILQMVYSKKYNTIEWWKVFWYNQTQFQMGHQSKRSLAITKIIFMIRTEIRHFRLGKFRIIIWDQMTKKYYKQVRTSKPAKILSVNLMLKSLTQILLTLKCKLITVIKN